MQATSRRPVVALALPMMRVAGTIPGDNFVSDQNRKLWGGRFKGEADPGFTEFNRSFGFDRRLFEVDVRASIAHCEGLAAAGVLKTEEANQVKSALRQILERGLSDTSYLDDPA
ncbi:MAG TPA: lyase family protein, partial [Pyrinomonadaceae bacterium]|nr:lyase family protein [Pyrinomonadaceae bacterium]